MSNSEIVVKFLRKHKGQKFTCKEISEELGVISVWSVQAVFQRRNFMRRFKDINRQLRINKRYIGRPYEYWSYK